jgi:hypothetical protein
MNNSVEELPTIFISLAGVDRKWGERMETQLRPFVAQRLLAVWNYRSLEAGAKRRERALAAAARANVAILLISASYLASSFVMDEEVPLFLRLREERKTKVIPVICEPCAWRKFAWLAGMEVRPQDGRPLALRPAAQAEAILAEVAEEVVEFIQSLKPVEA